MCYFTWNLRANRRRRRNRKNGYGVFRVNFQSNTTVVRVLPGSSARRECSAHRHVTGREKHRNGLDDETDTKSVCCRFERFARRKRPVDGFCAFVRTTDGICAADSLRSRRIGRMRNFYRQPVVRRWGKRSNAVVRVRCPSLESRPRTRNVVTSAYLRLGWGRRYDGGQRCGDGVTRRPDGPEHSGSRFRTVCERRGGGRRRSGPCERNRTGTAYGENSVVGTAWWHVRRNNAYARCDNSLNRGGGGDNTGRVTRPFSDSAAGHVGTKTVPVTRVDSHSSSGHIAVRARRGYGINNRKINLPFDAIVVYGRQTTI